LATRGALLGALMGVLLAPVLAIGSFLAMLILPLSLTAMFGDSMWTRLAAALHERRLRPLIIPVIFFVVLPMAVCGLGGSKTKAIETPMLISAGLGAAVLGAIIGGIAGSLLSKSQNAGPNTAVGGTDAGSFASEGQSQSR
jgi:hypothetical protein